MMWLNAFFFLSSHAQLDHKESRRGFNEALISDLAPSLPVHTCLRSEAGTASAVLA